ncbi:MAG: hypothetical protein K0R21_2295 [Anaerocolumna sp.]|jgi:cyclase|nr:hypothetical protein [Anaerocolumna sp.]
MLKKRLIFTLLIQNGSYMLSRNFKLQSVGDVNWLRKSYQFESLAFAIDELVVLNVTRGEKNMGHFAEELMDLVKSCFMPVAAGGGISSIEDAYLLFNAGADKVVINTALYHDPKVVKAIIQTFGAQAVVAAIDYKLVDGINHVFTCNGSMDTGLTVTEAVAVAERIGVGEIYLTSIERDGTGQGYDLKMVKEVAEKTRLPVIASGGVGKPEHLLQGIALGGVQAVATANLFNFIGNGLAEARAYMLEQGTNMAIWDIGWRPE